MFFALLRKECLALFTTPMAYLVILVFGLLGGYTVTAQVMHTGSANLVRLMYQAAVLLMLLMPLVTMRLIAEERRTGTLELLLVQPVSVARIVAAKYTAALILVVVLLGSLLPLPYLLAAYVTIDWGVVASGLFGLLLFGALLCAIGIASSALFVNQLAAAVVSMGLFLLLWVAETVGVYLPAPLDHWAINASFDVRLAPFVTGAVYLSDIGFFVTATGFALFVCVAALQRR